MKKLFLISIIICCFTSCVTIEFENPQPKKAKVLNTYPQELKGTYNVKILDNNSEQSKDTLIITDKYYQESNKNKRVYLSDSCILTSYSNDYIINFRLKPELNWTVVLLKKQNKSIMVYSLFNEEKDEDRFITEINDITNVQRVRKPSGEKSYVINPSKKQFNKIVNQGYFKPIYELVKIE